MKKILILLLFASTLVLTSCTKEDVAPTCEEGGELVEVK
jgi:hypothetical protein